MKKFSKKLPFEVTAMILAVLAVIVGVILIIFPETSLNSICLAVGIATAARGLVKLLKFIRDSREDNGKASDLIKSSLTLSLAIILMVHPKPILSIFPTIVGIGILIYGIVTLTAKGRNSISSRKRITIRISSIFAIVLGVVVINSPILFAEATTIIVGASLVIIGIFAIVSNLILKKVIELSELPPADDFTEVDFKDVDE